MPLIWFGLLLVTGVCLVGLTVILRGGRQKVKSRRRKTSVRKWVRSAAISQDLDAQVP